MLPVLKQRGFRAFVPRFQPSSREEQEWLWFRFAQTFGQTRSGTGHTHALGHGLPRFRTFLDVLPCCPQARLRTFPGNNVLGTRGIRMCWIEIGCQKRRIEIPLDWPNATGALMNPLREGFFDVPAAAMAILGQFGLVRRNFAQDAARACNGAFQKTYKHPWCAKSYASSVALLPRLVGKLFEDDRVAHCHDLVNQT